MKQNKKIAILSVSVIAIGVVGITGAWALSQPVAKEASADGMAKVLNQQNNIELQNKYSKIEGEAFDEQYVAGMFAHHEGAVNMAERAMAVAGKQEIKDLSSRIVQSQSREMGDLLNWQREWGYKRTYSNGHNGHSGGGAAMADTMISMQDSLEGKKGAEFDKVFLDQMIVHHSQAIAMSRPAARNAKHAEVKELARNVIADQEKEIAMMEKWQRDWNY